MSESSKKVPKEKLLKKQANVSIHLKLLKIIEIPKQSPFIDFDTMEFYRKRFTCW